LNFGLRCVDFWLSCKIGRNYVERSQRASEAKRASRENENFDHPYKATARRFAPRGFSWIRAYFWSCGDVSIFGVLAKYLETVLKQASFTTKAPESLERLCFNASPEGRSDEGHLSFSRAAESHEERSDEE